MATSRAPKQWTLTKTETLNSFTNWKENLIYILSLDNNFAPFLEEGISWQKKSTATPTRGFTNDGENIPEARRRTAAQKCAHLELMLGQIANYATIISRNTIVKSSTSLNNIWTKIREHYGFQTTGSRFLDLTQIRLQTDERPEDLYQRIVSFFDDNLVTEDTGLTHHGIAIDVDEEITPSIENVIVLLWLERINPGLPALIKQRYGAELRNKTLASIKPEISQALDALLSELQTVEESRVMRSQMNTRRPNYQQSSNKKYCVLCRTANRPSDTHYLSQCRFLPEADRRRMSRVRQVEIEDPTMFDPQTDEFQPEENSSQIIQRSHVIQRRVSTSSSPHMQCFYKQFPATVCLDTGAESSLVSERFAKSVGLDIQTTVQGAVQADVTTPLNTLGEIKNVSITRGSHTFKLDALVIKGDIGSDIIAGEPFLEFNDIAIRSAKKHIIIKDKDVVPYACSPTTDHPSMRRIQTFVCRTQRPSTVLPGESIMLDIPKFMDEKFVALEPRTDSKTYDTSRWPRPQITPVVDGKISLTNYTNSAIRLKNSDHFCQIRNTSEIEPTICQPIGKLPNPTINHQPSTSSLHNITIDKQLSNEWNDHFDTLHEKYSSVFDPTIGRYNDTFGKVRARVNIGPVSPPNRKLRVPSYSPENKQLLQSKFDELEQQGVFVRPEDVDVAVEHVSPSFLVKKPSGGYRLVTAFTTIGEYSKTLPTIMPTVDETLRTISTWNYIIATDLRDAFYQIPLEKGSMKWCATPTPFKGLRIYAVSAQGMPGSSETLEETMCAVLGPLIQEGCVAKIADDLYVGGKDIPTLFSNWSKTLERIRSSNLTLKANKTVVAPTRLQILGWDWHNGTISASQHKITPLASCDPPKTVTALRSFIGSYKVFNRVIRGCSRYLEDLENAIAGKAKTDAILWTDNLLLSFKTLQETLLSAEHITLPRPSDQLILVHDGSKVGIGSVLYLMRDNNIKLGGFFSAKLKGHQSSWCPCEIEALSIASSVKHFGPFIRQSPHTSQILTDNRPCVQAWSKMIRGEFSASARVATFMSVLSDYKVDVQHIKGSDNLPSDFQSRNPPECHSPSCQICKFVAECCDISVRTVSAEQILSGTHAMPFFNRPAIKQLQMDCPDLRRVHAHLSQGTRPTSKKKKQTAVKRYLQKATISRDGLLVVRHAEPFQPEKELLIIPAHVLSGIITAIHLRLNHPTNHQLKRIFHRFFFALNADDVISHVSNTCTECRALQSVPKELHQQSSSQLPATPGTDFAADVVRRAKQIIFVLRDTLSSYTIATLYTDENQDTMLEALITSVSLLRPTPQTAAIVRVDNAPGLYALRDNLVLQQHQITLDYGRVKNPNKNPVAEKAINELHKEIVRQMPDGGPMSSISLANVVSQLNSRLRMPGLSAWEIFHQRDQFSGKAIYTPDEVICETKTNSRKANHASSAKHKARGGHLASIADVKVGSLVYIKSERDKTKPRDRYIIVSIEGDSCLLQKLVKSQLRSKRYLLKLTEIIPVVPLSDGSQSYRLPSMEDSDSDTETIHESELSTQQPVANEQPRRPTRNRNQPLWMRSGEFELGHEESENEE